MELLVFLPLFPVFTGTALIRYGLFDVEELAQAAHRDKLTAIGVLAASINHEVKNPLFIIKGLSETWLERKRAGVFENDKQSVEKGEEAFQRSMEQADRAMDIIKRLSLFAKAGIDSEIKFEPVSIAQVLDDVLPLVRYELAAHGIALSRDMPPDLPEVLADRRYLEEILFNLIVNACQAIKETGKSGEIKMTAGTVIARSFAFDGATRQSKSETATPAKTGLAVTHPEIVIASEAKQSVVITIQDNGPGIPADKLKDVFRPFYTTKAEGTGLGLYITQQLVEKIRGKISVQSEVGVGTAFTVTLPVNPKDK